MDIELHKVVGYAIFLIAVCNLGLALTVARNDESMARLLGWLHGIGVLWLGRLELLMGLGVVMHYKGAYLTSDMGYAWQGWVAILLWGPIEVVAKRMVGPEIDLIRAGGQSSGRLTMGTGIQLLTIAAIFGLMHAIP